MHQTVVTLAADVQPRSLDTLRKCIRDLKKAVESQEESDDDSYEALRKAIPALHFASLMIFEDDHYDPLLTLELNIDGDIGPFLPQLETAGLQPYLRTMVRCCKRPSGRAGELYDLATAPNSSVPLAPFLETRIVRPAVFHQGNRGLDRDRILREAELFVDIQMALDTTSSLYRAPNAVTLHALLRNAMRGKYPWLDKPPADRVTSFERLADVARLVGFVAITLFCLAAPGMILGLLLPRHVTLIAGAVGGCLVLALAVVLWFRLRWWPTAGPTVPGMAVAPPPTIGAKLKEFGFVLVTLVALPLLGAVVPALLLGPLYGFAFGAVYKVALAVMALGLAIMPLIVVLIRIGVRWLEQRDSTQEDPHDDIEKLLFR